MVRKWEIADKIRSLISFQNSLNSRCHKILMKTNYIDLSGPSTSQGPPDDIPQTRNSRFTLNPHFISQERQKPWFNTVSDTINEADIMTISEWLKSGGAYTTYTDPARWMKLLLDQETAMSLDRMLLEKSSSGQFITIDILMDVLCDLITSRRSMKSRRKSLF